MKNKALIGTVALAAAFAGTPAFAQDKDWSFTVGIKGWLNRWDTKLPIDTPVPGGSGGSVISQTSDWNTAPIPSLAVRYRDFFVASSYFVSTSYDFPANTFVVGLPIQVPPIAVPLTLDARAKRKEFDINIGWYFVPQVAVTLGYKQINQAYTDVFTSSAIPDFIDTESTATKNKAPTIGIVAGAPIGNSDWLMYFNAASSIGPTMKSTVSDTSGSYKGWYATGEVGFGYRITPGLTATLGYKYQIIDVKDDNLTPSQRLRDTTNGPLLGISYTF